MSTPLLQIQDVSFGYKNRMIARFSHAFEASTFTAIIGNNGSGKSTLLKTISGQIQPLEGKILIQGENIHSLSEIKRALHVSMVFTGRPKVQGISVHQLLEMGRFPHRQLQHDKNKDNTIIHEVSKQLRIVDFFNKKLNELSDGEMQRCLIAMALVQETPVLLMDEPTAFLDYHSRIELFALLKEIAEKNKRCILISSHDLDLLEKENVPTISLNR